MTPGDPARTRRTRGTHFRENKRQFHSLPDVFRLYYGRLRIVPASRPAQAYRNGTFHSGGEPPWSDSSPRNTLQLLERSLDGRRPSCHRIFTIGPIARKSVGASNKKPHDNRQRMAVATEQER